MLENFIFSYVFLDLFSINICFSSIPFSNKYFFIASASDITSSAPFPPEGTNINQVQNGKGRGRPRKNFLTNEETIIRKKRENQYLIIWDILI